MYRQLVQEQTAHALADPQPLAAVPDILGESVPVWQSLLMGVGAIALVLWAARAIKKQVKAVKKSVGT